MDPHAEQRFAQAVAETTRSLIALDGERGAITTARSAERAVAAVREQWRTLRHRHARTGDDACAAVAELLEIAGWISFDAERQTRGHALNRQALRLSRTCGDRSTERLVLLNMSMQAAHVGRPRDSYLLAASALDSGALSSRTAAPFRLRQARAFALSGRRQEALRAFDHARSLFADGWSRHDPPWTWWLDQEELDGHHGWTYAALEEWDRAIPLLRSAVDGPQGPSYRILFTAELLCCLVNAGAWRDAEDLMADLIPHAGAIGSGRAVTSIRRAVAIVRARRGTRRGALSSLQDAAGLLDTSLRCRVCRSAKNASAS
ncbi:DNA-binding protein [Streptomyces sp. KR80]|uniref:DNA-binding protein n=1 Tax=Streptomyces sp. KR80 TaxID=3457426 RepID=UPI003FD45494